MYTTFLLFATTLYNFFGIFNHRIAEKNTLPFSGGLFLFFVGLTDHFQFDFAHFIGRATDFVGELVEFPREFARLESFRNGRV